MTFATAIVTGAGQGFGLALTAALAARGTTVLACARDADRLRAATARPAQVSSPSPATSPTPRSAPSSWPPPTGGSTCSCTTPASWARPRCRRWSATRSTRCARVLETTVLAPLALTQLALPLLRASDAGTIVTLSSDAAVEAYAGWGGYGAAKAALDHLAAVLAVEEPGLRVYAFDPGDMRTAMHQRAFPGEDISDRPEPETVVPALLRLLDERTPSGRYRAADLAAAVAR